MPPYMRRSFTNLTYRPASLGMPLHQRRMVPEIAALKFSYRAGSDAMGVPWGDLPRPSDSGHRAHRGHRTHHRSLAAVCKTVIGPSVRAAAWLQRQASAQAHHPRHAYGTMLQSYPGQRGDCWIASRLEMNKKAGTRRLSVPHHHLITRSPRHSTYLHLLSLW